MKTEPSLHFWDAGWDGFMQDAQHGAPALNGSGHTDVLSPSHTHPGSWCWAGKGWCPLLPDTPLGWGWGARPAWLWGNSSGLCALSAAADPRRNSLPQEEKKPEWALKRGQHLTWARKKDLFCFCEHTQPNPCTCQEICLQFPSSCLEIQNPAISIWPLPRSYPQSLNSPLPDRARYFLVF